MHKRTRRRARRTRLTRAEPRGAPSAEQLEMEREALLRRLGRLHAAARRKPGYRTARNLLNPAFRRANLAARAAILQAASFMIHILEMTPPSSV